MAHLEPEILTESLKSLEIRLPDGGHLHLDSLYLRDHCSCPQCRHPETKQRLLDTFSIPEYIAWHEWRQDDGGINISWNDGHVSFYDWDWLEAQIDKRKFEPKYVLWDTDIAKEPPTIPYEEVMNSENGVKEWTNLIRQWGFCFVDGCPANGKATQELIEKIAFIRRTHYGDFWQFTADLSLKDAAYTSLALAAHTDNTYFTDPAGLQTFHLLSHTDGCGGTSLLVDGFRAAETLRTESPEAFEALCNIKIKSHSSGNEGISIMPERGFPVFAREEDGSGGRGKVYQIRWNNDDRATLPAGDREDVSTFYAAARKWVEILRRPDFEYWVQLMPGRVLTFDNWRVLHGRSAFTGNREMCGAYTNMDDFISRWKTLNFSKEEVMNSL